MTKLEKKDEKRCLGRDFGTRFAYAFALETDFKLRLVASSKDIFRFILFVCLFVF